MRASLKVLMSVGVAGSLCLVMGATAVHADVVSRGSADVDSVVVYVNQMPQVCEAGQVCQAPRPVAVLHGTARCPLSAHVKVVSVEADVATVRLRVRKGSCKERAAVEAGVRLPLSVTSFLDARTGRLLTPRFVTTH